MHRLGTVLPPRSIVCRLITDQPSVKQATTYSLFPVLQEVTVLLWLPPATGKTEWRKELQVETLSSLNKLMSGYLKLLCPKFFIKVYNYLALILYLKWLSNDCGGQWRAYSRFPTSLVPRNSCHLFLEWRVGTSELILTNRLQCPHIWIFKMRTFERCECAYSDSQSDKVSSRVWNTWSCVHPLKVVVLCGLYLQ